MGYIAVILIVFISCGYLFRESKIGNVFDEMYYANVQPFYKIYTSTSFQFLVTEKVLENIPINVKEDYARNINLESYLGESLEENESLDIYFDKNKNELTIIGALNYLNDLNRPESFQIVYTYQLKSKKVMVTNEILLDEYSEMNYRTSNLTEIQRFMRVYELTEGELAYYRNYFLYEKVLSDWFEHNPKSRFSMEDLGDLEIIEADRYEE